MVYMYNGKEFQIESDHKPFENIQKSNPQNYRECSQGSNHMRLKLYESQAKK